MLHLNRFIIAEKTEILTNMSSNEKKAFISNTGWIILRNVVTMVLNTIIGALSARYLGTRNYGILNYSISYISIFSVIAKFGLTSVVTYELVTRRKDNGKIIGTTLLLRAIFSTLSVIGVALTVYIVENGDEQYITISFLQSLVFIFDIYEVFTWWYSSNLKSKKSEIALIISLIITSIWRVFLLVSGKPIEWFAANTTINSLFALAILCFMFFRDKSQPPLSVSFEEAKLLTSKSYHFVLASFATMIFSSCDKIMLRFFCDEAAVGIYAAAVSIACMWEFVPNSLITSSSKLLYEKKNDDDFAKGIQKLMMLITGMSIVVAIIFVLFGWLAVDILYGKDYSGAILPLGILIWSTGFSVQGNVRGKWMIAKNLQRYTKYYMIIGAVSNILLNALLIPKFGPVGAAIATLLSQIIVSIFAPAIFRETRQFIKIYFGSYRLFKFMPQEINSVITQLKQR